MLPGMELMSCPNLAVPRDVMHHVVRVESSYNPYAIGVVGGRLARQPRNLAEAVSTARMLEQRGYNFSLGLAQVNRYNLTKYGLTSYEQAFQPCANLVAGSRILRECYGRSGNDWGKSFSCYYSGDFKTGFRHGYVQKVYASMRRGGSPSTTAPESGAAIAVIDRSERSTAARPSAPDAWSGPHTRIAPLVERRTVRADGGITSAASSTLAQFEPKVVPGVVGEALAEHNAAIAARPARMPASTPPAESEPPEAGPVVVAARRLGTSHAQPPAMRARQDGSDGAFVF